MVFEPNKEWYETCCDATNRPDCVSDFLSLSPKKRFLFIFLSFILIGGGTFGCFFFAGAFNTTHVVGELNSKHGAFEFLEARAILSLVYYFKVLDKKY